VTTEEKLDRLAGIVDSLATSVVRHDDQLADIHATLAETADIQRQQAKQLLTHAKLLAEHDERLERIGRHLEVLIDIVDGMIRKSK